MLYMQHAEDGGEILSVSLALIAALAVVYVAMRFGGGIARLLKDDGIDLVSGVMGLILAAIAVQTGSDWYRVLD